MCGIACDLWCDKGRSRGLSGYQVFVAPTSVVRVRECFLRCDLKCEVLVTQSCPSLCDPMNCRLLCAWNSPGQNTGVGSLSLLQGIFPTQGSNPGLPHCRWILYQLSHKGSPRILEAECAATLLSCSSLLHPCPSSRPPAPSLLPSLLTCDKQYVLVCKVVYI